MTVIFGDDIVICRESREQAEENLYQIEEDWRPVAARQNTCENVREDGGYQEAS